MNIEQAKAAKAQLNNDIAELLRKFSNETGFVVEYVNIERLFVMGASISYVVTTDVKLS
jgi:fructoselysine-6-P-deglycase FrlB-like protein